MSIPISKEMIEPVLKSNISYVNNIEEFEKVELKPNTTFLAFDNTQPCFYMRECDRDGNCSIVKIFFYENFAQKIKNIEREEFEKKCREAGLDDLKTECACKFFLNNCKPYDVWIWVTSEKKKNWSWDYVISLKCALKKKLFPKIIQT
jgi:hypothetical protein